MKKLLSPDGKPVDSDRVMALNKWAHHLADDAPREIVLAGMGRPTFPVNKSLTNAEMSYWGAISGIAHESRRIIKNHERDWQAAQESVEANERSKQPAEPDKASVRGKDSVAAKVKKAFTLSFKALKDLRQVGYAAIEYTEPSGDARSRERIAEGLSRYYGLHHTNSPITAGDVLFTVGGSMALHAIFQVINQNQPHGRIITANPYYSLHAGAKRSNRLHTVDVMKLPGYRLTARALKAEIALAKKHAALDGGKISAFVFCYPNNPTGQVLSAAEWDDIAQVILDDADLRGVRIILDEAYAELRLDGEAHVSLFQVAPALRSRIVLIRSSTKALSAAGERMGVIVCKDHLFLEQLEEIQTEMIGHSSKSSNHAYAEALDALGEGEQHRLVGWYKPMVDYVAQGLKNIGLAMPDKTYQVNGTFYVMADLSEYINTPMMETAKAALPGVKLIRNDEDIAYHLLFKEQIMLAPLSYFGVDSRKGFVRITCSDVKHVEDLVTRLGLAITNLRKEKSQLWVEKVRSRLHELNEVSPEFADRLVQKFNGSGLANLQISQKGVTYSEGNLSALEYKSLVADLHDLYLCAGAEIKKSSNQARAESANRLKKVFRHHAEQRKSQRFFQQVDRLWYHWVDGFIEKDLQLEKKRQSPIVNLAKYPQWRLFFSALSNNYFVGNYDALAKSKSFDVDKFSSQMIGNVKALEKTHALQLEKLFLVDSPRNSESDDTESSWRPGTKASRSKRSSATTSSEGSISSSPADTAESTLNLLKQARKQSAEIGGVSDHLFDAGLKV